MSKVVDDRVVEMRFDNSNFERNVSTTMSTLDRFKEKLNLTGASKGLENIDTAANKINMNGLSNVVGSISSKFSSLEVIAIGALARIGSRAADAGLRLAKSLSIDNVVSGWNKLQQKANSISTLISQGYNTDVVEKQMEKLNWFSDETSYNFTDMIDNISKFTATGQKLEGSVTAMEGIALWAAKSGQNAQKASGAMYQLSQALGAGVMRREDYRSIQNASMDTDEFRQVALDTAVALGKLKKVGTDTYKSLTGNKMQFKKSQFVESLTEGQWFDTNVMMKVYKKYAKGTEQVKNIIDTMSDKYGKDFIAGDIINAYDALNSLNKNGKTFDTFLKDNGINGEAANELKKMVSELDKFGMGALKAGQEYRTFNDVIDATKDAVSTKWMGIFETILGNIDEQKELWSTIGNKFYEWFAEPLNVLQDKLTNWAAIGGRDDLFASFKNMYDALSSIISPIKEAFREIFPPMTAKSLFNFTKNLKDLTSKLILSEKASSSIKSVFKGLFSIIDIGISVIKSLVSGAIKIIGSFKGVAGGIISIAGSIGNFIIKINESIKSSNLFGKAINSVVKFLQNGIKKVEELFKELFKFDSLLNIFKSIWQLIVKIGSAIGEIFVNSMQSGDISSILNLFNTGIISGVLLAIKKFISNISGAFDNATGFIENAKGILGDVKGVLESYQKDIQANTLLKIAKAIAILAGSIVILSMIKPERAEQAVLTLTLIFTELLGAFAIFKKIAADAKGTIRASIALTSLSNALLILAVAMKIMSSMNWSELGRGLTGTVVGLTALIIAVNEMPEKTNLKDASKAIRKLSMSLLILAVAMKIMGSMSWNELARGLTGTVVGLTALVITINKLPENTKDKVKGIIGLSLALVILSSALKIMGSMSWNELARGLTGTVVGLTALIIAVNKLPENTKSKVAGLIGLTTSLVILSAALKIIASMSWEETARSLLTIGIALFALIKSLKAMEGTLKGAAALIISANALLILSISMKILSSISWSGVAKGLIVLAGSLAIMGIAASLLGPLVPVLLAITGAFLLFGLGAVAFGVGLTLVGSGLTLIAAGITALAISLAGGITAIIAGLSALVLGIINLIPNIIKSLGDVIKSICILIIECAPQIANTILIVIYEIIKSSAKYIPIIVDSLFTLLIEVLKKLRDRMPELIVTAMEVIGAFFKGIIDGLGKIDVDNLLKGTVAIGLLTGIMYLLSGLVAIIPSAMLGILGLGVLITELAIVLAAIGGLGQIPGLNWLITEGGYVLENIGTAIGKFVGGIVAGVAEGATSTLPKVANNLSNFMTNIQPFIDGAKNIDESTLSGVKSLIGVILALTAANLLENITSWLTGGSSIADFGEEISKLGPCLKKFSDSVVGIDPSAIQSASSAAKALAEMTSNIPNEGGIISWFAGDNSVAKFADNLPILGKGLKGFSDSITGINPENLIAASNAAKALTEMTSSIPNEGGLIAWITGENSITKFADNLPILGKGLKGFSDSITGINPENLIAASNAAKALTEMTSSIPNEGGLIAWITGENSITKFADNLPILGKGLKGFSDSITGINPENLIAASNAAKTIAEMCSFIPNEGGIVAWFTGDNSISTFSNNLPILGLGLKGFSDSIEGINPENLIAASNSAKAIAEMCSFIPNEGGMISWFTGDNSISNFSSDLILLGKGLKGFSTETADIIPENIISASNAAKALADMTSVIPKEGGIKSWFTGETSISNFADKLPALGKGLKGFSTSVEGIVPENVTAAANAAKSLGQMTSTIPKNTDKIIEFGNNLKTFGIKLKEYFTVTTGISANGISAANSAITAIKDITTVNYGSIKSVANSISNLINAVKNMSSVTKSSADNFNKALKTLGENGVNGFIQGLSNKEKAAKDACELLVKKCATAISNKSIEFKSAGKDVVEGFADGIDKNTYLATAKAKAMANKAKEAAKRELDINSPSKVFRKIGSSVPEGFAQGISMFGSYIKRSVSNMSTTAVDKTETVMSHLLDFINGGIDINNEPVIRPVLDLSNIESGANSLNNIFNNGPSIGVISNLKAISSGMNTRNQNGVNSDVISAINKLSDNLGNISRTTNNYNVNGVTYDDGSNIRDAVETLIRAAIVEGRV